MTAIDVRSPLEPAELEELAPVVAWAFGTTAPDALKWLQTSALEQVRLARSAQTLVGGLVQIPMGQWFGGKSVPMLGIAGVVTAPEARGQGVALALLREVLRDARTRGKALSALYPATISLYRKAGYELAGTYCRWTLRLADYPRQPSALSLRSATSADDASMENLYRLVAQTRTGYLDRGPYVWNRVRAPKREPAKLVVVEGPSGIEGYAALSQQRGDGTHHKLVLSDFVASTPAAGERLLRFLADHRTTAVQAVWYGGVADSRLFAFADPCLKIEVDTHWMLRLVDVAGALSARGYADFATELCLQVEDDVLPENAAHYRLRWRDGELDLDVAAKGGSRNTIRIDVRALAAIYSGFVEPAELVRAGMLSGEPRSLMSLAAAFRGAAPAMSDFF